MTGEGASGGGGVTGRPCRSGDRGDDPADGGGARHAQLHADVFDVPIAALRGPVAPKELETAIGAAAGTPSAANLQPWMFLVVERNASREAVARNALDALGRRMPNHRSDALAKAPAMVLACMDVLRAKCRFGERGAELFGIQDVAVAIDRVRTYALGLGLASAWVRELDFDAVGADLGLAPRFAPQALLVFGRADLGALERPPRLPPREYLRREEP